MTARFAGVLRGLGVGKGDRVVDLHADGARRPSSRCWPAPGWARCTRWCSAASPRTSSPPASTTPARPWWCPASCGIEPTRIVDYKPMLDAALELRRAHQPDTCVILQREQHPCELVDGRDLDWGEAMAARRTRRAGPGRRHRPALRALHLRHHRQAQGHRPRQRRARRRAAVDACATSTTSSPAKSTGPPPMSAGWSGTPTSSTRRCCSARRPCSTRASRSAPRTRARSGGWPPSTACKALFTAPTAIRAIKKEDPDGRHCWPSYDLSALRYLFQAGERLDPGTYHWAGAASSASR